MSRKHYKKFFSRQYEKHGLNGYVYDLSVDYNAIAIDDILDMHNYLMKEHGIV